MIQHERLQPAESLPRLARLSAELERIRGILARRPEVCQILVFGSMASGLIHEWSDLDLVIILETDQPFLERSVWLSRVVQPRLGVQFLAYTPSEMHALSRRPFVQVEMLSKGRVFPMNPKEEGLRWLTFAGEDLEMARLALNAGIFNQTSFHSQQCVEKCLKACLANKGVLMPRTHLIADLFEQLPAPTRELLSDVASELLTLDQFYIPTRYPDALPGSLPEGLPNREQAARAFETARDCIDLMESRLRSV